MKIDRHRVMGWRRHVVAALTERLALKAAALAVALMLWFIVSAREPTEDVASVRFAPRLDSALVLRDPSPPIRARVIGRPSEILKLANTPLTIRRQITSDAPDTLVLPLRAGDVDVPDGVEVIVSEVYPQALTLRFETTASRRVPVRSRVMVLAPVGSASVPIRLEPDSVTVLGPRRSVARLAFVATVADSIVIDTLPHLVDLDTAGIGVLVRPSQVKLRFGPFRQ